VKYEHVNNVKREKYGPILRQRNIQIPKNTDLFHSERSASVFEHSVYVLPTFLRTFNLRYSLNVYAVYRVFYSMYHGNVDIRDGKTMT
jgi:hypothetical protein